MVYQLPELPYGYGDLDPLIDEQTMHFHHDKHHATYISNLNAALAKSLETADRPLFDLMRDLESVPEEIRTAVRNNGGGHLNHTLYWQWLSPDQDQEIPSELAKEISQTFGSVDHFKKEFINAGLTRFGSGWAWLVLNEQHQLQVVSTANQDNPLSEGLMPILGVDVWEHAYYLNYQNRRPDYLGAFWHLINWEFVDQCWRDREMSYLQL
ncbi:superoxide dismutase [Lapidilactobacillus dextrinicus DSM 20335]|uniref:Superoxide dismutase n=1 Tax=Lapidilactobacillus dextrinicus DSM 20335 TaxID=1423738 RepID=A0A0R2BND0_9LACO|nr:superoxide dismutase [Lapidilactobacillus dextrinicus]KRM79396.1 superoxide dismutase [Lapidilactobacillus dextrinicus DSM 20335]QFG46773.1 superoxide dismutase [Lapidilactobacillus dextrinicus]